MRVKPGASAGWASASPQSQVETSTFKKNPTVLLLAGCSEHARLHTCAHGHTRVRTGTRTEMRLQPHPNHTFTFEIAHLQPTPRALSRGLCSRTQRPLLSHTWGDSLGSFCSPGGTFMALAGQ